MAQVCLLAPQNWTDGATAVASAENASFPASNLLLYQPRERYQAPAGTTDVEINVTRSTEAEINVVAPLFANIHNEHASWRLRIAHTGEITTSPWYDSSKIFLQSRDPHLYALRFIESSSRVDWTTTFTMTGSWLLEAVVRIYNAAPNQTLFKQITGGDEPHWFFDANRRMHFEYGAVSVVSDEALEDFVWTHVAVAHDDTANELRLYMNGTLVKTRTSSAGPFGAASSSDGEMVPTGADVAEFRGWTTARNDASILADAFGPISDTAGLATYLKLDAGSGTSLTDTHSGGPGATQTDCRWIWPQRFWMSPALDNQDRTHAFWWDEIGGLAGHVRIEIRDELGDEAAISIGTLALSAGRRPSINILEGSAPFGVTDFGSRDTAPSGVTHVAPGASVDTRPLLFMSRSDDELYQVWHPFLFGLGNSVPLLFCSDPTDVYYRFQRTCFGFLDGPLIPTTARGTIHRLRTQIKGLS